MNSRHGVKTDRHRRSLWPPEFDPSTLPPGVLFMHAFNHAPIGMALVAPDGHWLRVNRSICELTGYSGEELMGRRFQDITHPDDLEEDERNVARLLRGEASTYQMEKRYFRKDGSIVWAILSVSLVSDETGQPLLFVSQVQDITERKSGGRKIECGREGDRASAQGPAQSLRLDEADRSRWPLAADRRFSQPVPAFAPDARDVGRGGEAFWKTEAAVSAKLPPGRA